MIEDFCAGVVAEVDRIAEVARGSDLTAPVPTCPGWTVTDLLVHLGGTQRWAEHIVRTKAPQRVPFRQVVEEPGEGADPVEYLTDGVAPLLAALRAADPDEPVWAWGEDRHQRFWPRRMLHEALIHRADVELAFGLEPVIDKAVAVDALEEFLANLPYAHSIAPRLAELASTSQTLHLHATDTDGEWLITLPPEGYTWSRGHAKGDLAVRGPIADLLLMTYGRRPADALTVFGDHDLLARWLTTTAL